MVSSAVSDKLWVVVIRVDVLVSVVSDCPGEPVVVVVLSDVFGWLAVLAESPAVLVSVELEVLVSTILDVLPI